ncbi:unnamed protein product, partial [Tilletia controversa]
ATAAAAWADFTAEEVRVSLQRSAKNTAPGPDQIPWEVLIHLSRGWPDFNDVLARLYSASIRYGHHPRIWKEATVVVLRKPNKPDYSLAKAYRPISLLNTTAKLLEGMVARRILRRAEAGGLIPPNHFGGRPFRSTEDALLALTQFAKHAHRNGRHVALMTADVSGAYNGVQGDVLAADLERLDWPDWVIQWVGSFMTERSSRLRFADHIGEVFAVPDSLPQGSPLSQLLWLVYSGGLVGATDQERKSMSVGWVDDWTIAVASPSFDDLQRRLQGICDIASNWADTHKSRFDQDKTSVCIMPKNKAAPVPDIDVRLQGTAVQTATSVKMLGVTFQSDFKFNTHVNNTVRKATAAAGALLSWGNRAWGFSADNMRTLYSQGVAPIMEYACAVWLPPDGFRGGLSALNKFRKVQRSAAIRATGAFKSTSTASLDFESGLTPVHLRLYERQALSLLRLRTVPETHPLTKVVNQACSRQPRRHKGPLHMMAAAYPDVATAKVRRKLPPDTHIPQPTPITIPDDKTAALAFHDATVATTYPTQLHVYTDGSGHDGRFGAAVHFRGGDPSTRPDDIRIGLGRIVAWMPGHVNAEGNEGADAAAKEAAELEVRSAEEEPAAVRMWIKRRTRRVWQREWDSSATGASHRNTNKLRVGQATKLYKGLARPMSSLLAQLRTNHIGTNDYLRWRKVKASALCDRCNRRDTREHLMFACAKTKTQRASLLREVGRSKASSLSTLLNDGRLIKQALKVAAARFDCYRWDETPTPDAGAVRSGRTDEEETEGEEEEETEEEAGGEEQRGTEEVGREERRRMEEEGGAGSAVALEDE